MESWPSISSILSDLVGAVLLLVVTVGVALAALDVLRSMSATDSGKDAGKNGSDD